MSEPITIRRARRTELGQVARLLGLDSGPDHQGDHPPARFFEYSYLLAEEAGEIKGTVGWEIINLVACIQDIHILSGEEWSAYLLPLLRAVEGEARALHGEVAILYTPLDAPRQLLDCLKKEGFAPREVSEIHRMWREVAQEQRLPGQRLWLKPLADRIATRAF